MAVELYQRKNGLSALACFSIQPSARSVISSSMVSMRFLVSGPVSTIFCPPLPSAVAVEHAARAELLLERRILGIVGQLRLFLGVQVIEVAEELVEAVHGRQVFVPIAEVVLAELAGGVAERLEQLGDGRIFRLQADRRRRACRPWSGRCGSGSGR